jgi:hypothetical protein
MASKEPRDAPGLARLAQEVGWRVKINNALATIYPPEPTKPVTLGLRMNDWRAFENAKARLRRAGLFDAAMARELDHVTAARRSLQHGRAEAEARIDEINTQAAAAAAEGAAPMARRDAELHQLVERCKAVEWRVRSVGTDGSHVIVTPPEGRPITIATGSSMRNYPATVLSKLTKAGLLEAEDKMSLQKEERRQRAIREDRAKAEARTPKDEPEAQPEDEVPAEKPPAEGVEGQSGEVPGGVTEVGGVLIAEWGYAKTPVGAVDRKATELLLEDGTIVYACHLGDFTGKTWQAVSKHRRAEHPKEQGRDALRRRAKAEAEPEQQPDAKPEPKPEPEQAKPQPAEAPRPRTLATAGPIVSLKPATTALFEAPKTAPAAPSVVFRPATPPAGQHPLAQLLGSERVARDAAAAVTPAQPAPVPVGQHPLAQLLDSERVAPAPVAPRRAEPLPPTVRAGISTVAAASPKPDTAAPPPADGAGMNLATMVSRMRQLAGVEAEVTKLKDENAQLRDELDLAQRQGASLAEQCVLKDAEIRRLRAKAAADAATVATAQELQKVMSALMGGSATQLAA